MEIPKNKKQILNTTLNIVIGVLIFLLFCSICSIVIPKDLTKYQSEIKDLNAQISSLNEKVKNSEKQISDLTESNKSITDENQKLKEENNTLENEKNELNAKLTEQQKTVSSQSSSTTSSDSSVSNSKTNSASSAEDNFQMVWVGETGNKYHVQNCRTLKGKGHQITLQQALSEGKQACKVCH